MKPQQPDLNWPCFEAGLHQRPAGPFQPELSNYSVISLLDVLSFVSILKGISGTVSRARELLEIARYPGAGPSRAQHLSGIAGHKQFTCEHTELLPASCAGDQADRPLQEATSALSHVTYHFQASEKISHPFDLTPGSLKKRMGFCLQGSQHR